MNACVYVNIMSYMLIAFLCDVCLTVHVYVNIMSYMLIAFLSDMCLGCMFNVMYVDCFCL